jgi:hypothetical protein
MTERSYRLDMIRMIVRNEHVLNRTETNAVVPGMLLQRSYSDSNIYQQSVCCGSEIIAITAATASKRYKSQHFNVIILCKSTQKRGDNQRNRKTKVIIFNILNNKRIFRTEVRQQSEKPDHVPDEDEQQGNVLPHLSHTTD